MFCCERKSDQSPVRPTPVDFLSWFGSRCCRLKMKMFRKVKVEISWKVKVKKIKVKVRHSVKVSFQSWEQLLPNDDKAV